ncbi:MAG: hypothetical protein PHW34_07665 [Hespellia sp.]|nr:hypothetical protein [Hespellia sp.]
MLIYYEKLFNIMKIRGKNTSRIREEKIIGQETLRKLKTGTGIFEEYKDPNNSTKDNPVFKRRITSIDTKAIESLCTWLECTPNDIMEVIPNTIDNSERLCKILGCTVEELPSKVPMEV